jgi:peroxiredoxin
MYPILFVDFFRWEAAMFASGIPAAQVFVLAILAVNFQERPDGVKQFFSEHSLTFAALLDGDGKVAEIYQAWGLPVTVMINKRGE